VLFLGTHCVGESAVTGGVQHAPLCHPTWTHTLGMYNLDWVCSSGKDCKATAILHILLHHATILRQVRFASFAMLALIVRNRERKCAMYKRANN
jgi:hypothetical protein